MVHIPICRILLSPCTRACANRTSNIPGPTAAGLRFLVLHVPLWIMTIKLVLKSLKQSGVFNAVWFSLSNSSSDRNSAVNAQSSLVIWYNVVSNNLLNWVCTEKRYTCPVLSDYLPQIRNACGTQCRGRCDRVSVTPCGRDRHEEKASLSYAGTRLVVSSGWRPLRNDRGIDFWGWCENSTIQSEIEICMYKNGFADYGL